MTVLRQQASHLLLIPTNFGYGTVLTAACAPPGCSVTHYNKYADYFTAVALYPSPIAILSFYNSNNTLILSNLAIVPTVLLHCSAVILGQGERGGGGGLCHLTAK
jgi:hypothetical protein